MQTLAEGGEHKHYYLKYEQYTPLYYACKRGHPELVLDILFHHTGRPFPEMETLLYEQRDRVAQLLIEHKADFRLCLCQAARQGEYPVASLLLMMGADPNGAPAETVERIVIERRPPLEDIRVPPVALRHRPLMQACWGGHVHIVKLLLQYYAKVTDDEINAAFDGDHREIATLLLEAKDQQRGGTSVLDDEHSANYVQPQRSRPQQQVQQATLSTSQTNTASYPVLNNGATPAQYHQDFTPSYHETNRQQQTQQPSPRGPRRDSNASSSLSVEEYSTYPPATSASASASYAPPPPEHAQYLEDGNLIGSTGHGNDLNSIQVQVDTNSDPHQHHNQPQLGELLDETYAAGENSYTPSSLHIPLQPEPLYQQHQGGASSMHSPQQPPRALTPSPRAHSPLYPSHVRGQQPQQQLQSHLHTPLQPLRERAQSQDRMTLSSSSSSNFNNNSQHLNHRPSLQEEQLSDHHSPGDSRSSLATADFDASSSIFEHRRSRSDEPSFIRTAESSQPVNNTPYEQQHRTLEQQPQQQQQQQQQYQIYPHFDPYQQPQQTSASSSLPYQPQAPSYPHQYQQRQQQTSPPPYPGMGSGDASSSSSSQAMLRQYQQHQQAYNHPSSPLRPTPSQSSGLAPQLEFLSLEGQTGHSPPASPSHSPSQQQQPLQHRPSQQLVGLSPMRVPPSPASPPSPMPVHHPHHPYGPPPMNAAYDVQAQALKAHAQAQAAQVQAQIQARAAHHVQMQQQQQEQQRQQQQQAQVARIQQQASPQPALDYYGGGGGLGLVEIGALAAAMAKEARQDSAESKERAQVTTEDGYELDFDELEISREIARGSFGIVYFGKFRGTEVAIKKLLNQKLTKKELDEFSSEINVMKCVLSFLFIFHFFILFWHKTSDIAFLGNLQKIASPKCGMYLLLFSQSIFISFQLRDSSQYSFNNKN
ncbi:hypothetical protein QOT17_004758 [Balamuthia mandrillaris]